MGTTLGPLGMCLLCERICVELSTLEGTSKQKPRDGGDWKSQGQHVREPEGMPRAPFPHPHRTSTLIHPAPTFPRSYPKVCQQEVLILSSAPAAFLE